MKSKKKLSLLDLETLHKHVDDAYKANNVKVFSRNDFTECLRSITARLPPDAQKKQITKSKKPRKKISIAPSNDQNELSEKWEKDPFLLFSDNKELRPIRKGNPLGDVFHNICTMEQNDRANTIRRRFYAVFIYEVQVFMHLEYGNQKHIELLRRAVGVPPLANSKEMKKFKHYASLGKKSYQLCDAIFKKTQLDWRDKRKLGFIMGFRLSDRGLARLGEVGIEAEAEALVQGGIYEALPNPFFKTANKAFNYLWENFLKYGRIVNGSLDQRYPHNDGTVNEDENVTTDVYMASDKSNSAHTQQSARISNVRGIFIQPQILPNHGYEPIAGSHSSVYGPSSGEPGSSAGGLPWQALPLDCPLYGPSSGEPGSSAGEHPAQLAAWVTGGVLGTQNNDNCQHAHYGQMTALGWLPSVSESCAQPMIPYSGDLNQHRYSIGVQ